MTPLDVAEMKHSMAGLAEIIGDYAKELRRQGFSRRETIALVIAYQTAVLSQNNGESAS